MFSRCFSSTKVSNIKSLLRARILIIMAARRSISTPGNINSKTSFNQKAIKKENGGFSTNQDVTLPSSSINQFSNTAVQLSGLTKEEENIYFAHKMACEKGESTYIDPVTEYAVFTENFLKQRKSCCGNCCRHCPYGHVNVPSAFQTKSFNGAFYM